MDVLTICPVSGLYRELYYPTPEPLEFPDSAASEPSFLDANNLYWGRILSPGFVSEVVDSAAGAVDGTNAPISFRAAISDAEAFKKRVVRAKTAIANQGLSPREFFSQLETLNIFCALHASFSKSYNVPFTVQNAWLLQENSTEEIFQNCLMEEKNPYLLFIREDVLPLIQQRRPKVIFLMGRPGYFSFALALLVKKEDPSIFIGITQHSSEYYSLNKIDFLLTHNQRFFQVFDAVILEHFSRTEQETAAAVLQGRSVRDIPNLVCLTEDQEIVHTGYPSDRRPDHVSFVERRPPMRAPDRFLPPHTFANVHLLPYVKCYWNQCTFCGINKKYHFENPTECYSDLEERLCEMERSLGEAAYIWFIDEALHPDALRRIARFFKERLPGRVWQARCRVEKALLADGLPEFLAASGLRELRLGLESGSYSVLKRMNKFDSSFSFALLEEICERFDVCGISIHFPIIIGFPGESDDDRRATYALLRKLSGRYKRLTFNINIFELDIGSTVFRRWYDFSIQGISFPCEPRYFLGNWLDWRGSSITAEELSWQRNQFMREILYPWMPAHCLTPPHILYRLSETIRNTLVWKERAIWPDSAPAGQAGKKLRCADNTVFYDEKKDLYYVYSWFSHHYILANKCAIDLLESFRNPASRDHVLSSFIEAVRYPYSLEDLERLTERFINDGFLLICA